MTAAQAERPGEVLERVEAELRALWSTPPAPGELPRARACTMNLVVVAATPGAGRARVDEWVPVVDEVLLGLPARAIVVGIEPGGEPALEAGTTAVCTPQEGGGLVCSERITLFARGDVCARLHSCVAALCTSDVPTVLVWLGPVHADEPAFGAIARDASRIVLDSRRGPVDGLTSLVYWSRARSELDRPGIGDLAWTCLAPWQEMCARMFDEPGLRALAAHVTRLTLRQASGAGVPLGAEGALLMAWLATRLGWRLPAPRDAASPAQVEVVLVADPAAVASPGALLAVRLEGGANGVAFRGEIVREPGHVDAATWRLEVTRDGGEPRRLEQHVRLRADETAGLLERTLHRPTHDPALADAAAWADELEGEELACGLEGDNVATVRRLVREGTPTP